MRRTINSTLKHDEWLTELLTYPQVKNNLSRKFTPTLVGGVRAYTCLKEQLYFMATISRNVLVNGFRGRLGDSLVFKTMRGKTFVSTPARKPNKKKETLAQRGTRVTFKQASEWAQIILLDPDKKTYYQQRAKALKLPNAYTAALTDYMRKPVVKTSLCYDNSTLCTVSKKDFNIKQVTIEFKDANGDSKEVRTLKPIHHKAVVFKLTSDERQNGVRVCVSDMAGRITVWDIASYL